MASKAGGIAVLVLFGLAALASTDSGCDIGNGGDGDFDFDDSASTCDGVVVVETASGNAQVPGNTSADRIGRLRQLRHAGGKRRRRGHPRAADRADPM